MINDSTLEDGSCRGSMKAALLHSEHQPEGREDPNDTNICRNAANLLGGASFPPREVTSVLSVLCCLPVPPWKAQFSVSMALTFLSRLSASSGLAKEAFGPVHAHGHRSVQQQLVSMLLLQAKDANRSVLVILVFPSIFLWIVATLGRPIWTFILTGAHTSAAGPSLCPEKIQSIGVNEHSSSLTQESENKLFRCYSGAKAPGSGGGHGV